MYEELVALLRKKYDKAPMVMEAADAIEELSMKLHGDEAAIAGMKREIDRMVVAGKPRWIPVTEQNHPKAYEPVMVVYVGGMMRCRIVTAQRIGVKMKKCGDGQRQTIK